MGGLEKRKEEESQLTNSRRLRQFRDISMQRERVGNSGSREDDDERPVDEEGEDWDGVKEGEDEGDNVRDGVA